MREEVDFGRKKLQIIKKNNFDDIIFLLLFLALNDV